MTVNRNVKTTYRTGRKFRVVFNLAFFVGGSSHEIYTRGRYIHVEGVYTWKVELIPAKFSNCTKFSTLEIFHPYGTWLLYEMGVAVTRQYIIDPVTASAMLLYASYMLLYALARSPGI